MDYLVTMTTHVPDGTSTAEVDEVRTREGAHTRDLAAQGRVLRLWRPPLAPGEWRTIGLFVADDPDDLERTLASMPLRVWRTDAVTPLGAHPNDPGQGAVSPAADRQEFLVTMVVNVPDGTTEASLGDAKAREAARTREQAAAGQLLRLWTLPEPGHNLGVWQAAGEGELQEILRSLPMADWLTVGTVPLTRHPSDPATATIPADPV